MISVEDNRDVLTMAFCQGHTTSCPDNQGHQENLAFLSNPLTFKRSSQLMTTGNPGDEKSYQGRDDKDC